MVFTMGLITKVTQYADNYYKQIRFLYKLLAFLGMLVYLGYHSLSGENGYKSYKIIKKEVEERQKKLSALNAEFAELKIKVEHLSNKSLDLDLLEERCRTMLNYAYPGNVIIRTTTIENKNNKTLDN